MLMQGGGWGNRGIEPCVGAGAVNGRLNYFAGCCLSQAPGASALGAVTCGLGYDAKACSGCRLSCSGKSR
jgi:hypothetical protein